MSQIGTDHETFAGGVGGNLKIRVTGRTGYKQTMGSSMVGFLSVRSKWIADVWETPKLRVVFQSVVEKREQAPDFIPFWEQMKSRLTTSSAVFRLALSI